MKFAVVEYTSKSGKIWRHTPKRPNYVCDPQKEIDPTSFGCYVSALAGEHIPLSVLIAPTFIDKVVKRFTGSWRQTYSLEYLASFDVVMIVHQISDGHEITAFTRRLKETYPTLFIIGVATQPFGLLQSYWETHPGWLRDFREFMELCHVYVSIVKDTVPQWQKLAQAPVEYLPQPYPSAFASQFYQPHSKKQPILFVAGVPSRPLIVRGMTLAKKLQQEFPEYLIHVTEIPGMTLDTKELAGSRFAVRPFENWQQHLRSQGKAMLIINTDYTFTRGRVQMDCAAVGTPSLGANSDAQRDLFPDLFATPETPLETLLSRGRKILTDEVYFAHIVAAARERLPFYDYETSAARVTDLITRHT